MSNLSHFPDIPALRIGPIAVATGQFSTTNDDLAARFGTSPEVILRKIGIVSRPICPPVLRPKELALRAARQIFNLDGFDAAALSLIITSSSTVGQVCPPVSCEVLHEISKAHESAPNAMAFDIMATCTGWLYALAIATDHLHQPGNRAKFALINTVEMFSLGFAEDDFGVWASFGDVATTTAVYGPEYDARSIPPMQQTEAPGGEKIDISEVSAQHIMIARPQNFARPDTADSLWGPPAYTPYKLRMDGRELRNQSMPSMLEGLQAAMDVAGLSVENLDWVLAHQSNQRVLADLAAELGIAIEKVPTNLILRGNTSSSALPLLIHDHRIRKTSTPGSGTGGGSTTKADDAGGSGVGAVDGGVDAATDAGGAGAGVSANAGVRFGTGDIIGLTAFGGGYTFGGAIGQIV